MGKLVGKRTWEVSIALLVVTAVFAIYAQVATHHFVLFDDTLYVTDNYFVLQGFTRESVGWAIGSLDLVNWHPLTFFSHMLDVEFWGLRAGGHALTNVVLHALASVLLFALTLRLSGSRWAAAFVALVFAIHPANVESVAWIAQRKSVLSAVFWFATILAYLGYVAQPTVHRYLAVLIAFAFALMSKPAVVTLPFVLLLLDWWPLGRFGGVAPLGHFGSLPRGPEDWRPRSIRLVVEKVPFLTMCAAISLVTYLAQRGAMAPESVLTLTQRVANAASGVIEYLRMFGCPGKLAVFYPLVIAELQLGPAAAVVIVVSLCAIAMLRRLPFVFVGWFWFLGVLLPMSGLVQVGSQRMADRYLYLPMIGLVLGIAWSVLAIPERWRWFRLALGLAAVPWVGWLGWRAHAQVKTWQDDNALCEQTDTARGIPRVMLNNLALQALTSGRGDEAAEMLRSIPIGDVLARRNLAVLHLLRGEFREAADLLESGSMEPNTPAQIHFLFAQALAAQGRIEEARSQLELCRAKIPPRVQWKNSIEVLRRIVNAPGFSVEQLIPAGSMPGATGQSKDR